VVRRVCLLGTTVSRPILQQRDYPVLPPLSAGCQGVLKPRRVVSGPSEPAVRAAVPNHAIFGVDGAPCQHLFAPSKTRSGTSVARRILGTSRIVVWVTLCGRWAARERDRTREGVDSWRGHLPPSGTRCAHAMVSSSQPSAFSSMLPFMTTISLTEDDVVVPVKMARCGSFPRRHTARPFGSARFLIQVRIPKPLSKGAPPIPSMSGFCVSALQSQSWKMAARVTGKGSPLMDGPNLYL
jgi:hypothetical protein